MHSNRDADSVFYGVSADQTHSVIKAGRFGGMINEFYTEMSNEKIIANIYWMEKVAPIEIAKINQLHQKNNAETLQHYDVKYVREFEYLDWARIISIHLYVSNEVEKWDNLRAIKGIWNIKNKELFKVLDIVSFDYRTYLKNEELKLGSQRKVALKHDLNRRRLSQILNPC